LTTSQTIKQAMLRDLGSRDVEFIAIISEIREQLLKVAGVSQDDGYEAVLMQGSGTFGIESVIGTTVPPNGKLLVVINGAYGERIAKIAEILKIDCACYRTTENSVPDPAEVDRILSEDGDITNVAVVHCETTTGIMNPIEEIGRVVRKHERIYFVDSMSAFGSVPFDFHASEADYLVSSANKCIEGVPGFSFALCRRSALESTAGWARSVSLDLHAQWRGLEANGQFRFTPPTHVILAFRQALRELEEDGGVAGRGRRYEENYQTLVAGMRTMGFREYLERKLQGYIITSFHFPEDPRFTFEEFYQKLNDKGYVIYPGKVSNADCFRIGNIGRLFTDDVTALLAAIGATIAEMGIDLTTTDAA
jgi:2-aminoethylphosphonate-pyruvate transaminase